MVIGIGTDLVEIDRFRRSLARTPGLRTRLFRPGEQEYADRKNDPTERYAARFAAKEAVLKALGLGLGAIALYDIEVIKSESGAPELLLHGTAQQAAQDAGVQRWLLTLSHTEHTAMAIAVAL